MENIKRDIKKISIGKVPTKFIYRLLCAMARQLSLDKTANHITDFYDFVPLPNK